MEPLLRAETGQVTVNQTNLVQKLLGRYKDGFAVIRELCQNADDAGASEVKICIGATEVSIENNGRVFTDQDWNRLKSIADGNQDQNSVGMFGVGWFSVFALSNRPAVYSGPSAMRFTMIADSSSIGTEFGRVEKHRPTTLIRLPDIPPEKLATFRDFQSLVDYVSQMLAFTRHLARVECDSGSDGGRFELWKEHRPVAQLDFPFRLKGVLSADSAKTREVTIHYRASSSGLAKRGGSVRQGRRALLLVESHLAVALPEQVQEKIREVICKRPPSVTRLALVFDPLRDAIGDESMLLRTGPAGRGEGRIFVGFPLGQTTGCQVDISAQVYPTMEREAIDFNGYLGEWNKDLIRTAGQLLRGFYDHLASEASRIDVSAKGASKARAADQFKADPRDVATLAAALRFARTAPAKTVHELLKAAFFGARPQQQQGASRQQQEQPLLVPSTRGVMPSHQVRLPLWGLEALVGAHLPVLPAQLVSGGPKADADSADANQVPVLSLDGGADVWSGTKKSRRSKQSEAPVPAADSVVVSQQLLETFDDCFGRCLLEFGHVPILNVKDIATVFSDMEPLSESALCSTMHNFLKLSRAGVIPAAEVRSLLARLSWRPADDPDHVRKFAAVKNFAEEDVLQLRFPRHLADVLRPRRPRRPTSAAAFVAVDSDSDTDADESDSDPSDTSSTMRPVGGEDSDGGDDYADELTVRLPLPLPPNVIPARMSRLITHDDLTNTLGLSPLKAGQASFWQHVACDRALFATPTKCLQILALCSKHHAGSLRIGLRDAFRRLACIPVCSGNADTAPATLATPEEAFFDDMMLASKFPDLATLHQSVRRLIDANLIRPEMLRDLGVRPDVPVRLLLEHLDLVDMDIYGALVFLATQKDELTPDDYEHLRRRAFLPRANPPRARRSRRPDVDGDLEIVDSDEIAADSDATTDGDDDSGYEGPVTLEVPGKMCFASPELDAFNWPQLHRKVLTPKFVEDFLLKLGVRRHPEFKAVMAFIASESTGHREAVAAMNYVVKHFDDVDSEYKKAFQRDKGRLVLPCRDYVAPSSFGRCRAADCVWLPAESDDDGGLSSEVRAALGLRAVLDDGLDQRCADLFGVRKHLAVEAMVKMLTNPSSAGLSEEVMHALFAYIAKHRVGEFRDWNFASLRQCAFLRLPDVDYPLRPVDLVYDSPALRGRYGTLLDYWPRGPADVFLTGCGVAVEPDLDRLVESLLRNHQRVLDEEGNEPYVALMELLAKRWSEVTEESKMKLKNAAVFPKVRDGKSAGESDLKLGLASDAVLVDNVAFERLFNPWACPSNGNDMTVMYAALGARWLTDSVTTKWVCKGVCAPTPGSGKLETLIKERKQLICLDPDTREPRSNLRKTYLQILDAVQVRECLTIKKEQSFQGISKQEDCTAGLETVASTGRGKKQEASSQTIVFSGADYVADPSDVISSIAEVLQYLLFDKKQHNQISGIYAVLSNSVGRLQSQGYPVDMIVREPKTIPEKREDQQPVHQPGTDQDAGSDLVRRALKVSAAGFQQNVSFPGHTCRVQSEEVMPGFDLIRWHGAGAGDLAIFENRAGPKMNADLAATARSFSVVLSGLATKVFKISQWSMAIYLGGAEGDRDGCGCIAFNRGGQLFFNLSVYRDQLERKMSSADIAFSWYSTMCHELAHNIDTNHNQTFVGAFGALLEQFFAAFSPGNGRSSSGGGGTGSSSSPVPTSSSSHKRARSEAAAAAETTEGPRSKLAIDTLPLRALSAARAALHVGEPILDAASAAPLEAKRPAKSTAVTRPTAGAVIDLSSSDDYDLDSEAPAPKRLRKARKSSR